MLSRRLKLLRGKRTQNVIAKAVNVSRARYSHYENARSEPDTETLEKLADYFNVTTDYLLGRTEEISPIDNSNDASPFEPQLVAFFKEVKNAPEQHQEKLRKIWEVIKSEDNYKSENEEV